MSKAPRPDVHASTERLQVTASYARVRLAFGAPLMLALSGVKSTAYRVSHPAKEEQGQCMHQSSPGVAVFLLLDRKHFCCMPDITMSWTAAKCCHAAGCEHEHIQSKHCWSPQLVCAGCLVVSCSLDGDLFQDVRRSQWLS